MAVNKKTPRFVVKRGVFYFCFSNIQIRAGKLAQSVVVLRNKWWEIGLTAMLGVVEGKFEILQRCLPEEISHG